MLRLFSISMAFLSPCGGLVVKNGSMMVHFDGQGKDTMFPVLYPWPGEPCAKCADGLSLPGALLSPFAFHRALPLTMCLLVVAGIGFFVGKHLIRKTVPFGLAVTFCMALEEITMSLPYPWNSYQPSSAIVTVVLLMEPGITLERLIVKSSLRVIGHCFGCVAAVVIAYIIWTVGDDAPQLSCFCFAAFTLFAAVHEKHAVLPYIFPVMCVTCAVVIFGFLTSGWKHITTQIVSVLMGEVASVSASVVFEALCGDATSSFAVAYIMVSSTAMLEKTFVALDLTFMNNEVNASDHGAQTLRVMGRQRSFAADTLSLFSVDHEPTLSELKETMQSGKLTRLHGRLESTESSLLIKCRESWSHVTALRSILSVLGLTRLVSDVDYSVVPEQMHRIFVQACALSHAAPVPAEQWLHAEGHLESLRRLLKRAFEPLKMVLRNLNVHAAKTPLDVKSLLLTNLCETLEEAQKELAAIWQVWKAEMSNETPALSSEHFGSLRRLASFCYSFDVVIADFANFVLCQLHLLGIVEPDRLHVRLQAIVNSPSGALSGGS
eukprot:TRINITY_DN20702_c0_g1_i1.p1 TRINITY_DN20702_c0_g1~~TRINITY_DN20702_c0_g1_i1.p1  ORF type:complete len:549 (+),score=53.49 TRINITY_DN20702_c0_g1_i1:38-1684(+)